MSGNERDPAGRLIPSDALYIKQVSGILQPLDEMCPYVYKHAYSPHLAAQIEGSTIQMQTVENCFQSVRKQYEYVTMEGTGGIICPLHFGEECKQMEDVIWELGLFCLLVANADLGTINAVGLTAAYMKAKYIPLKGIILNRFHPGDVMEEDNLKMCEFITGLKVLACVKCGDRELDLDAGALASLYELKR